MKEMDAGKIHKNSDKKIISLAQILILLLGILAFNFIISEINESKGIETATGIGIVEAAQTQCEQDNGVCATSCNILKPGSWEFYPLSCEIGSGKVCCKPVLINPNDIEPSPGVETDTFKEKELECPQGEVPTKNGCKNWKEFDKDDSGDLDEKESKNLFGSAGEVINTGNSLITLYTGLKSIFAKGKEKAIEKIAEKTAEKIAEKTGKQVGKKLIETNLGPYVYSAAGALVGSFLNWALFKWIVKADVRNMRSTTAASGIGFVVGTAAGPTVAGILAGGTATAGATFGVGLIIALVVALIITLTLFKNYSQETFNYIVTAWKASDGGNDCDLCNDIEFGCSEYQCRSFGKACEIVNDGTTQQACVWKDPDDIFPPEINESDKYLPSEDYNYLPLDPLYGVKVNYPNDLSGKGCAKAYSSIKFGIETNEYADCKIDTGRTSSYDEMIAPLPKAEGKSGKEHFLELPHVATPSVESQQAAGVDFDSITNGQSQEFYIRCKDANGNTNTDEYIVEFCVQDGPDTSAPLILGTNFPQDGFLQYNSPDPYFEIYTNEPAECKWEIQDLEFDSMQFEMDDCSQSEGDYMFSPFGYGCIGNLVSMKDDIENKVYVKCKDKPTETDESKRYANEQPYILALKGTDSLLIDEITVNGKLTGAVIKDSVSPMSVKFEAKAKFGAENGKARCQYEFAGNWINFYNEGSVDFVNVNTNRISLNEGSYNYSIRCFDAANNVAEDNIEFTLGLDNTPPIVARAYYDVNNLKVITDEPAECVYTLQQNIGCSYEFIDGTAMSEIGETTHYTSWQPGKKYFIKCKDSFGNQPLPGQCSIIVKAFESY